MRALCLVFSGLIFCVAASAQTDAFTRGAAAYDSDKCPLATPDLEASKASEARANLLLGHCYLEAQPPQLTKAIEALTAYTKKEAGDIPALVLLAQAHQRNGKGETGVTLLQDFVKAHPDAAAVHAALGDLYVRLGQAPQATAAFQAALAKRPDDPFAHIGLANLAFKDSKWQAAIDEYAKARAVVPNNFDALSGTGLAYVQLGNCNSAADALSQARRMAPTNYAIAKPLADCFGKLQRWGDLMAALQTRTKEEAADEEATGLAVRAYQGLADNAGAEKYYNLVLAAAPANVTAHTALGDLLFDAKKIPEAKQEYEKAVSLKPGILRLQGRLAEIAADAGQTDEAIRRYKLATVPGGSDADRMKLANLCFTRKEKDLPCARTALDGVTESGRALTVKTLRAQIEFEDYGLGKDPSKLDQAGRLANEALREIPEHPELLRIAGNVAYMQEKWTDAVTLLSKRLALVKTDKDTRYLLVRAYSNVLPAEQAAAETQLHNAEKLLTEYITQVGQDFEAYLLLGNVYLLLNDIPNAKENFRLGMDRLPDRLDPKLSGFFNNYGILLFNNGDYEGARVQLTKATNLDNKNQDALFTFAMACLQLENRMDDVNQARGKLAAMNSSKLPDLDKAIADKLAAAPPPAAAPKTP